MSPFCLSNPSNQTDFATRACHVPCSVITSPLYPYISSSNYRFALKKTHACLDSIKTKRPGQPSFICCLRADRVMFWAFRVPLRSNPWNLLLKMLPPGPRSTARLHLQFNAFVLLSGRWWWKPPTPYKIFVGGSWVAKIGR